MLIDQAFQVIWLLLAKLIVGIRPVLPIVCALIAWGFVAIVAWNLFHTARHSIAAVRKLHRIPCDRCRYASYDYRLKCSLHPSEAFSEQAIQCQDLR